MDITEKKKTKCEEFIRMAKEVHKDENLDYSQVNFINTRIPVLIIDNDLDENGEPYGEYWQSPYKHLHGSSHPRKRALKIQSKKSMTREEVIKRFQEKHSSENMDYSEVEYVNMHTKVKIICHDKDINGNEYGEFWVEPSAYIKGCTHPKKALDARKKTPLKVVPIPDEIPDYTPITTEIYTHVVSIAGEGKVLLNDSTLLGSQSLDIYVPSLKFAVDFNPILVNTEKFGKDKWYHLNKTKACQEKGVVLYQVFEDEYLQHKDLVLDKIGRFLLRGSELPDTVTKVYARNCDVREVSSDEARDFLDKYHLQGYSAATVYLGAFYGDFLVAVMSFKADDKYSVRYELNRFSTDYHYHCVGLGGKLFSHFIENYSPEEVKTFLDRRWCYSEDDNLYTKIGFVNDGILAPEYRYTDGHGERLHKFLFRKQKLAAKYGLDINLTETEMVKKLGYEKIWDCGLIRYRWTRPLV